MEGVVSQVFCQFTVTLLRETLKEIKCTEKVEKEALSNRICEEIQDIGVEEIVFNLMQDTIDSIAHKFNITTEGEDDSDHKRASVEKAIKEEGFPSFLSSVDEELFALVIRGTLPLSTKLTRLGAQNRQPISNKIGKARL